uniref:Uncharacterized protein n=1 Tax=Arundo donax TaxID=35708 RepID=A0A0A9HMT2_ARUDO
MVLVVPLLKKLGKTTMNHDNDLTRYESECSRSIKLPQLLIALLLFCCFLYLSCCYSLLCSAAPFSTLLLRSSLTNSIYAPLLGPCQISRVAKIMHASGHGL